ncbi:MAG: iron ABC transporter permease [Steroidobacteraceae bacterium]
MSAVPVRIPPGTGLLLLLALPALVPLVSIVTALATPDQDVWQHLFEHVLPRVTVNTITLGLGVALLSAFLGTGLAWLTAMCEFPGRRFFDWALLLPLAIPGYVLAFVAVGFLDYAGPLQTTLRNVFGTSAFVPPIRSWGGVTVVLSLTLYPYVYLLARSAFLTQGRRALEAAQTMGLDRWRGAWHVALPLARPWIAAGMALVTMETLADFGTVSVFNYDTFTTAIYRAWFGLFSAQAALELAGVLMLFVIAALALERYSRGRARFHGSTRADAQANRIELGSSQRWLAAAGAAMVFAFAFALPMLQLVQWTARHAIADFDGRYVGFVLRSIALAASAAAVILAASIALAYVDRTQQPTGLRRWLIRIATTGYAIPGTVLAVGLLVPVIVLNNQLQALLERVLGTKAPLLMLHGTLFMVLIAYIARFLAVGFNPIESGLQRVTRSIDEAAMNLGVTGRTLVRRIHLPLLRTGMATAAALVFVDVMKEMPITLLTRPFGWDTLAIRVFEMTSEGQWERASLPALAIVLVGLIPTALLIRRGSDVA